MANLESLVATNEDSVRKAINGKKDLDEGLRQQQYVNADRKKNGTANETDEWYTPEEYIAAELGHYPAFIWKDQDIICPCDWDVFPDKDIYSVRFDFTKETTFKGDPHCMADVLSNFKESGNPMNTFPQDLNNIEDVIARCSCTVNKLSRVTYKQQTNPLLYMLSKFDDKISVGNPEEPVYEEHEITGDEAIKMLTDGIKCNFVKQLLLIAGTNGCNSITASGYRPNPEYHNTKNPGVPKGWGFDFLSVDYSQYTMVVTNPPFSFYKEFMKLMTEQVEKRNHNFNYILLTPFKSRANPMFAEGLQSGQHYLGFGRSLGIKFRQILEGNWFTDNSEYTKDVACDWITTYPYGQDHWNETAEAFGRSCKYYLADYEIMQKTTFKDGTHPIVVGRKTIPDDYSGWMKAPGSIIDKDFDTRDWEVYYTNIYKYFNTEHPELSPLTHKFSDGMKLNKDGKIGFQGVFIRRKPGFVKEHPEITWYSYEDVMKAREEKETE